MPTHTIELDVAILGGGIAGLWTLAHLRRLGYNAVLFSSWGLGAGQTIASQGIIHGGVKYALTGAASSAARAISQMPLIWSESLASTADSLTTDAVARAVLPLAGDAVRGLSRAQVLSPHQYLWTTGGIGSRFAAAAASKVIRTPVARISPDERPAAFTPHASIATGVKPGDVYRVDEPVLDVMSVVTAIHDAMLGPHGERAIEALPACIQVMLNDPRRAIPVLTATSSGVETEFIAPCQWALESAAVQLATLRVRAKRVVLAAGGFNETLLSTLDPAGGGPPPVKMQRRPLHMVMLRSTSLPELFGHCIGLSDKPRVTITTSRDFQKRAVWYIGGQLAEQGVTRTREAQIAAAREELRGCVPWIDLDRVADAEWATLRIDRAEGLTPSGERPDEPVIVPYRNTITVWPTKLAFAPLVAQRVAELLAREGVEASPSRPSPPPAATERFCEQTSATPAWFDPALLWTGQSTTTTASPPPPAHSVTAAPLRRLGETGILVPAIGLGTVKLGRNTGVKYPRPFELPSDADALALLERAFELGVNLIDTAPAYGVSEARLGALLARADWFGSRSHWILSTKAGEEFDNETGTSRFDFSAPAIERSVQRSLERLRTSYLDIVLIHSDGDDVDILRRGDALGALKRLKDRGLIRAVGISTKTVEGGMFALNATRGAKAPALCDVLMVTLNAAHAAELPLIQEAGRRGVGVLVKKAFNSGHVAGEPHREQDPARAAIDFVFRSGGAAVSSIVAGTLSPEHLEQNVRAAEESSRA